MENWLSYSENTAMKRLGNNEGLAKFKMSKDGLKKIPVNCKHHPFDLDIDINENQYCTICGKITKTAEELYGDDSF